MKKSLLLGILGAAAVTLSSHGQGILILQNYQTPTASPYVNYGNNVPANGVSGALGAAGTPINSATGWTAGFYWAAGTVSVPSDPSQSGNISSLLTLATGGGSTAAVAGPAVFNTAGAYAATSSYTTTGVAGGATITMETTVYSGSSYGSASYRGHSDAYQLVVGSPTGNPTVTGPATPAFSVSPVPEPSILALSGIGAAALALIRRKK